MTADINEEDGRVILEFEYESYTLSSDEAKRIGNELIEEADKAGTG